MLRNDMDKGRHYNGCNWAFNIKSILDELGCTDTWLYQDTIPIPLKKTFSLNINNYGIVMYVI